MKARIVVTAVVGAGAGAGWIAWELLKPGLRKAERRNLVISDMMTALSEGFTAVDAWAAPIAPGETDDPGEWVWAATESMLPVGVLLKIRDALVAPFGVATVTRGPEYLERMHNALTGQTDSGKSRTSNLTWRSAPDHSEPGITGVRRLGRG